MIHYYYPDKRELLKEALRVVEEEFIAGVVDAGDPSAPADDQLAKIILGALPLSEAGVRSQRVWFNLLATAMVSPELSDLQQEYYRRWRATVRERLEAPAMREALPGNVDAEQAAHVIVAFCDGLTLLLLTGSAEERERIEANVGFFVDRLLAGRHSTAIS